MALTMKWQAIKRQEMPVLTRAAAKRLEDADKSTCSALTLRESVTSKARIVWNSRDNVDVYTGASSSETDNPQVDHCLEIQLAEVALVRAFSADRNSSAQSMATAQATELLRGSLNGVKNLNVTSTKINGAKRGPFTAALNRLQNDTLRSLPIEQLARQGRAKWMVDDGTWARVERAIVKSYDDFALDDVDALPAASKIVKGSVDELGNMLHILGLD